MRRAFSPEMRLAGIGAGVKVTLIPEEIRKALQARTEWYRSYKKDRRC